jgi:hypothetical protein
MSLTYFESARRFLRPGFTAAIGAVVRTAIFFFAVLVCLVLSHVAAAATINYPDPPMGNTVSYVGVSETSLTDPVPLFGAPIVTGDSIDFNPVGFGAFSAGGGNDLTDGQLVFMILAKPGFGISNINFAEAGITTLAGLGTNNTYTDVSATGRVDIQAVDGVPISTISIPLNLTFAPNADGTFELVTDAGLGLSSLPWNGGQLVDLSGALTAHSIPFTLGATKISVDLDNGLVAQSELGTLSLIDKKDFGGLSVTVNMPGTGGGPNGPEPTSLLLACLGFGGLAIGRRFAR